MKQVKISSKTRVYKAGQQFGKAVVENVHLLYLKDNALEYLFGLLTVLKKEFKRRKASQ